MVPSSGSGCPPRRRTIPTEIETGRRNRTALHPLEISIGLAAGEPVVENDDLFGAAVQLAARLCDRAASGSILVSGAVRHLAIGKQFAFVRRGRLTMKGCDEPIGVFEVGWRESDTVPPR